MSDVHPAATATACTGQVILGIVLGIVLAIALRCLFGDKFSTHFGKLTPEMEQAITARNQRRKARVAKAAGAPLRLNDGDGAKWKKEWTQDFGELGGTSFPRASRLSVDEPMAAWPSKYTHDVITPPYNKGVDFANMTLAQRYAEFQTLPQSQRWMMSRIRDNEFDQYE